MELTFRPSLEEMSVGLLNDVIYIEFDNQDGCLVGLELNIKTANTLIRCLIEHLWINENVPDLAARIYDQEPDF